MKKIILIFTVFLLATSMLLKAQKQETLITNNTKTSLAGEEYLSKSKTQKTVGFILIGAGVTTIALISNGKADFSTTGALVVASGAAILGSIPFFIASGKNKRKSELMLKDQTFSLPGANLKNHYAALGIKIKL